MGTPFLSLGSDLGYFSPMLGTHIFPDPENPDEPMGLKQAQAGILAPGVDYFGVLDPAVGLVGHQDLLV